MPMTFEDARVAVYTRLYNAWSVAYPTVPVFYENRLNVDLATQAGPFIACEVLFVDGEQVSIEVSPVVRYRGAIYLASFVKEHEGTKVSNGHLTYLADLFKTMSFAGVHTEAAVPQPGQGYMGWYRRSIRVPFWFDVIP